MRPDPHNKIMTANDEQLIIERYQQGLPASKILMELNGKFKTTKTIYDTLRRFNLPVRSVDVCQDPNLDHFYFNVIDSPEKAYALGLMISDGWVTKKQTSALNKYIRNEQIGFSLKETDELLVSWMKQQWNSTNKINTIHKESTLFPNGKIYQPGVMKRILVTSARMFRDLNKLGVDTNKSYVSILPIIQDELYSHLLRGILDGDGSIGVYKYGGSTSYLSIRFIGSLALIGQISWFLHSRLGLVYLKPVRRPEAQTLSSIDYMTSKDVRILFDYVYSDKELATFLDRKFVIGENFLNRV